MFKETIELNGKPYIIMLTRKAKLEIEERQKRKSRELANNQEDLEVLSAMSQLDNIQEELDKIEKMKDGPAKDKKMEEYTRKYLPLIIKINASDINDDALNPYELVYILIHSNPNNSDLSKEDYEKGIFNLEMEIGLVELEKKFKGYYDKVFHEMELINKALNTPEKPIN